MGVRKTEGGPSDDIKPNKLENECGRFFGIIVCFQRSTTLHLLTTFYHS
jgi:hypothetical protein